MGEMMAEPPWNVRERFHDIAGNSIDFVQSCTVLSAWFGPFAPARVPSAINRQAASRSTHCAAESTRMQSEEIDVGNPPQQFAQRSKTIRYVGVRW